MPSLEYQLGIERDSIEDSKRENKCQNCKFCGWDPDGNYCGEPSALKISNGFGKSLHER